MADLSTDLINKSFESCASSLLIDGSADDVIHHFSDSDVEDASDPRLWIDSDQEGDKHWVVDVLF